MSVSYLLGRKLRVDELRDCLDNPTAVLAHCAFRIQWPSCRLGLKAACWVLQYCTMDLPWSIRGYQKFLAAVSSMTWHDVNSSLYSTHKNHKIMQSNCLTLSLQIQYWYRCCTLYNWAAPLTVFVLRTGLEPPGSDIVREY